jgi:hypothetical protein
MRGKGSFLLRRSAPRLQARRRCRRGFGGPLAWVILPTVVEKLEEPPPLIGLARQASRRHGVGSGAFIWDELSVRRKVS